MYLNVLFDKALSLVGGEETLEDRNTIPFASVTSSDDTWIYISPRENLRGRDIVAIVVPAQNKILRLLYDTGDRQGGETVPAQRGGSASSDCPNEGRGFCCGSTYPRQNLNIAGMVFGGHQIEVLDPAIA